MIYLTGDINLTDGYFDTGIGVGAALKEGLNPFEFLNIKDEDFWIGNFEGVCSDKSDLSGVASKQFIVSPELIKGFKHPNLYGVANNHVMQHGQNAYNETINNLSSLGCEIVGTKEKKTVTFNHQGKKISVTAFSQRPENFKFGTLYWSLPEYSDILEEIKFIPQDVDFKIAYLHWGNEFMNYPYIDQIQFAHLLIDSGFDLIVGMHPHILQGYEIYKEKYIFYSLGNTVFNMPWKKTKYGAIVCVDLKDDKPKVTYLYTDLSNGYAPKLIDEKNIPKDCSFNYLNNKISLYIENEKYYSELRSRMKEYRKSNYKNIILNLKNLKFSVIKDMTKEFIKRRL